MRVTAANPGIMTGPGTNTYLVGTTELVVVDPGPLDEDHAIAVAAAGGGRIGRIVVTHTHRDHAPGSARLAQLTGAEVIGFGPAEGFRPDRSVRDGVAVEVRGVTLRAVHTPGHASDHLCWLLEQEATLFSGDHVMEGSTVVIAPPDGDMTAYLESLRRLRGLDPPVSAIAPGHGRMIGDPAGVIDAVVAHRRRREEAVAAALGAAGTTTVDELLPVVYAEVATELVPVARFSLWAHLRKLRAEGRAETDNAEDFWAPWRAVG